jgi:glycosyltransferase involved in cell wall biosynthesis
MEHRLKVAVFLDQHLQTGGGYQQSLNSALLMRDMPLSECETVFITCVAENLPVLERFGIQALLLPLSRLRRLMLAARRLIGWYPLLTRFRKIFGSNYFEGYLERLGVDLVYFTSPSDLALDLERLNYLYTVWDLCHLDDPEFPEVRNDRKFELREMMYQRVLPKAAAIFTDSIIGSASLIYRYRLDAERIHVLPFQPAVTVAQSVREGMHKSTDIKSKYQLECDYVFYPAQFWAHKNHVYLLEGLKELEQRFGLIVGAVFAGGTTGGAGNLGHVTRTVEALGLSERIRIVGFVPNEEVSDHYSQSIALVMPTYFGPTNIPPLEAFILGVPVVYPDKRGLREQVGSAALLMDLNDPGTLAKHLAELIGNRNLAKDLTARAKQMMEKNAPEVQRVTIERVIARFALRRRCWSKLD